MADGVKIKYSHQNDPRKYRKYENHYNFLGIHDRDLIGGSTPTFLGTRNPVHTLFLWYHYLFLMIFDTVAIPCSDATVSAPDIPWMASRSLVMMWCCGLYVHHSPLTYWRRHNHRCLIGTHFVIEIDKQNKNSCHHIQHTLTCLPMMSQLHAVWLWYHPLCVKTETLAIYSQFMCNLNRNVIDTSKDHTVFFCGLCVAWMLLQSFW